MVKKSEGIIFEVCAGSAKSCIEAQLGGATRVELCSALSEGGVTPGWGEITTARKAIFIKLNVLIRPRPGDFLYNDLEFQTMLADIASARKAGADGVVFGCLNADGTVDMVKNKKMLRAAKKMSATFHRAFDMCRDPFEALEQIIELGFDRILTSGQQPSAVEGADLIQKLIVQAAGRIAIMPGGGINDQNIAQLKEITGAREFHFSARKTIESQMQHRNHLVSMSGNNLDEYTHTQTSAECVTRVIKNALR